MRTEMRRSLALSCNNESDRFPGKIHTRCSIKLLKEAKKKNSASTLSSFFHIKLHLNFRPDMTEKLLTGTLSLNTTNQTSQLRLYSTIFDKNANFMCFLSCVVFGNLLDQVYKFIDMPVYKFIENL